jgi:hypothetical protein
MAVVFNPHGVGRAAVAVEGDEVHGMGAGGPHAPAH